MKLTRREAVVGAAIAASSQVVMAQVAQANAAAGGIFSFISPDTAQETETLPATTQTAPAAETSRPSLLDTMPEIEAFSGAAVPDYTVADDLSNVENLDWFYLSDDQLNKLKANGFFCYLEWGGNEFFELYETNRYELYPNFVTVDAMMHTYHLYFGHLMKNTERNYLSDLLKTFSQNMYEASKGLLDSLRGTSWESAAVRVATFFAVGCSLLGIEQQTPDDVSSLADEELAYISAADGIYTSPSFENNEDYSQYTPRGYYEGDEVLEGYFRAMMWYGRMNFAQNSEDLTRSALLVCLALTGETLDIWSTIYTVTSFFAGASDDNGYYEYQPLILEAYGDSVDADTLVSAADAWEKFYELTESTPAPKINSIPTIDDPDTDTLAEGKGFRVMGQRFSIDESIFEQLVYSQIGENSNGDKRMLPDTLDIPAAFGSEEALSLLELGGACDYEGYTDHMDELRDGLAQADNTLWNASLYAQWLRTLKPLCEEKPEGYPAFMRARLWPRKCLQTFAGSYAELKHDTILYAKQIMSEMGDGGPIDSRDDRGYVEAEPEVFARLAALTQATSDGLSACGLLSDADADNLGLLSSLASQLQTIAEKELTNELPTDDEFDLIRSFGGQIEHFWQEVYKDEATSAAFTSREFPSAIVADVATDPNGTCLEVATGKISEIFVIVPVDGSLRLALGAVYSFYQFEQPISDRLTDTEWRQMMGIEVNEQGSYASEPAMDPIWWTQEMTLSSRKSF